MAKDLVSSLGEAELNALIVVQLRKLSDKNNRLNELLQQNGCTDFNSAYSFQDETGTFAQTRDALLGEVREIVDMLDKLCAAQRNVRKAAR